MEGSSPLAFQRPLPVHTSSWGSFHNDTRTYNTNLLVPFPQQNHNAFRNIPTRTRPSTSSDYFSCKTVSSPASGLAVDLAQNLHVDQSPQLPTPKRTLFTHGMLSGLRASALTPPITSSSPGLDSDAMDCTPLPHKRPHHVPSVQIDACPTPGITPEILGETSYEPPSSVIPSVPSVRSFAPQPLAPLVFDVEKIRPRALQLGGRPPLRKSYSTSNPFPLQAPFQFHSSIGPALESFNESPEVEKAPVTAPLLGSTIPFSLSFAQNGSPSAPLPSRPVPRPTRRPYRRSQSMQVPQCAKPVRQEKRSCTDSSRASSVTLELHDMRPKLPHFVSREDPEDTIPRLSHETFLDVLNGVYDEAGERPMIIDCRFEYEYNGGHIDNAVNYNDKERLANRLFQDIPPGCKTLIFHCEFSKFRAPTMAKFIRAHDRTVNQEHYPRLSYPEIYVLDGGYSAFFNRQPTHCYPQAWVKMEDTAHEFACERGMANMKRARGKLQRAHTYTVGQGMNAFAVPRPGGAPGPGPSSLAQHSMNLSTLPPLDGSPMGPSSSLANSMAMAQLSPSLDAMEIDSSSPAPFGPVDTNARRGSEAGRRGSLAPKRFDSF